MRDTKSRYKVVVIAPTCFYYQVSLFRELAAHPGIDLMVYFCSKEAVFDQDVRKMFRSEGEWGNTDELLTGYKYKFLRNYSFHPSYLTPIFGLVNLGVWREIRREKPDAVILMSWMNPTWLLAVAACLFRRIPFLYMTDANVQAEPPKSKWKTWVKRLLLGKALFNLAAGFLCAGTANRKLYQYYGVPEHKLIPFAYSWGYGNLVQLSKVLIGRRYQLRAELGIPSSSYVILFCGRLIKEKNLFLLMEAYERIEAADKALVLVGDGELKPALQSYVARRDLDSVYFFGFQSRRDLPRFYAISDLLVLPSRRETWGIVVNEAMCFGLPVIVSDQVGASDDLVRDGYNGFTFPEGDGQALADSIRDLMALSGEERGAMGERSSQLIREWLDKDLPGTLAQYLDSIYPGKAATRAQ